MRTIYKQKLEVIGYQEIKVPTGSTPLHIGTQFNDVCIWYECDPTGDLVPMKIHCFGTGHKIGPEVLVYISTVKLHDDSLVLHFYVE